MNFKKLNYTEPAVLRGVAVAGLGLLASLGFVIPEDLPGEIETAIVAFSMVLPLGQAIWTRARVWSPKAKDDAVAAARPMGAAQRPGIADHGRP